MAYFDSIKLEKGMYYTPKKSFSQVLEELDPSEQYENSDLQGLDAFQRQLRRFDIKVSGENSDPLDRFFQSSESAALFPEYVARAVTQGIQRTSQLQNLVATVSFVDTPDYRTISVSTPSKAAAASESTPTTTNKVTTVDAVAEGDALPQTTIANQKSLVTLKKHGRVLAASFESLRFHKLDLFTVTLRQIGADIARDLLADAVNVLYNGDGNNNALSPTTLSAKPTYSDFVDLWAALAPFQLNTILASTSTMKDLLTISEFKDPLAGMNFQGSGKLITPLGANLIHTSCLADKIILALDKNCALEMVQAGNVTLDYDKLIDRQLERAAISSIAGFARIFPDAVKAVSYAS